MITYSDDLAEKRFGCAARFLILFLWKGIIMRINPPKIIRPLLLFLLPAFSAAPFSGAAAQSQPYATLLEEEYWQQKVDYVIKARLDTENKLLTGSEKITYLNNSPDTLKEFHIHLYPNAYREKTSRLIEDYMPGTTFFLIGLSESRRGWMDVTRLAVDGEEIEFKVQGTVLSASFPSILKPDSAAVIEVEFKEKIRKTLGRAGYTGKHFDMAQWYPKMAVYDKRGWHPDQFRKGEFYGDFGDFDVSLTLPAEYVVAATGTCVSGDPGWEKGKRPAASIPGTGEGPGGKKSSSPEQAPKLKEVRFVAERVHDFAWSADPDFMVKSADLDGIEIMTFHRSRYPLWADSAQVWGERSIEWLREFVGPYHYPSMKIVESPLHGGMEYPMLVMIGHPDESLILHEIGHNYFYGMLANDERYEAWMDEGFTQYQTFRYMRQRYGPSGKSGGGGGFMPPGDRDLWKGIAQPVINAHRTGYAERVATPHHEFQNSSRTMLYLKAPLFLRALRYVVGEETFDRIIHSYFDKWKFKHVDEKAFLEVCRDVSGMDLEEIFKEWLHTTKYCDYAVEDFDVEKNGQGYRAVIRVERKGEMIMPFTLLFRFRDGNSQSRRVDGLLRTIREEFIFDEEPVSVALNPANEILDIYQRDNYMPRRWDLALDNPLSSSYPDDAYQFRLLPVGFYNDIDGGVFGLRVKGGYDNFYDRFTLQPSYGAESGEFHFYADIKRPLGYLGRDASLDLAGFYREGRRGGTITIDKALRDSYSDPLPKNISLWLFYHELFDASYVYPWSYEEGINFRGGFNYALYPKTDLFASSLEFGFDRSIWGSDFNYERYTFETKLWPARRFPLPIKPRARFFIAHNSIDPPLQEKYNFSGAGAPAAENYFWMRSVGAFWKDSYNNMRVAGGANLRGYYDGSFAFKRVFASNIELEFPLPLPLGRKASRMIDREVYLFYDWGRVYDEEPLNGLAPWRRNSIDPDILEKIVSDFGIGVRFFGLSAEFPVYLSHPSIVGEDEKWDFRWTIAVRKLF